MQVTGHSSAQPLLNPTLPNPLLPTVPPLENNLLIHTSTSALDDSLPQNIRTSAFGFLSIEVSKDTLLLSAFLSLAQLSVQLSTMNIRQYQVSADVDPKAYQYKSIDPNKQIRIVELLPGNFHAPIELKITEEDLNAEYDALSYTWGDHNSRVSISVKVDNPKDTKSINVTRNLSMALRHLRDHNGPRSLWIDALCINQKDSAEKAHQVAMMTQIYENANQVRIWLGPEADGSDLAMQTLRRGVDEMLGEDLMDKENNRVRRALEALPRRDYWTRVWVVQEIFMARSIKIHCGKFEVDWKSAAEVFPEFLKARADLLVRNMSQDDIRREQEREQGRERSPRRTSPPPPPPRRRQLSYMMDDRAPWVHPTSSPLTRRAPRPRRSTSPPARREIHSTLENGTRQKSPQRKPNSSVETLKGRIADLDSFSCPPSIGIINMGTQPIDNVINLAKGRSPNSKKGSWWLFDMLLEHRHYGATDERDKIFSMLGLLDQSPSHNSAQPVSTRLFIDYNLSFLDVSIRLFNYLALYPPEEEASEDREKWLLNVVCASQPETNRDFPTWLPDFSRDNGMQPWPFGEELGRPVYFAAEANLSYDSRTLSIQGASIGTITAVTDNQDDCQAKDDLSLLARLGYFLRLIPESFRGAEHFWKSFVLGEETGQIFIDALTKEPCPDTNHEILEALEVVVEDESDRSTYQLPLSEKVDYPEILRAFLNEFRRKSYRRRFAVFGCFLEHKRPKDDEPSKGDEVPKGNTEKLMAMVPEDAKEGDSLYQLGSCEYWVLLRPIATKVPCFHFVGPVYLAETPSWLTSNENTPKWISLH